MGFRILSPIFALVALCSIAGCDDDDLDRSCIGDTDCQKIDSCCDGCTAVSVREVPAACDDECIEAACTSTDQEDHVAVCRRGSCELVAPATR